MFDTASFLSKLCHYAFNVHVCPFDLAMARRYVTSENSWSRWCFLCSSVQVSRRASSPTHPLSLYHLRKSSQSMRSCADEAI